MIFSRNPARGASVHRTWFVIAASLLLVSMTLAACDGNTAGEPTASASGAVATPLPPVKADGRIVADGRVVPVRSAELSLSTSGIVAEVLVAEGDQVETGQLLLSLQADRQRANVAQAQAGVQRAVALLDAAKAGARSQEIDAARAAVDAVQAGVDRLEQGAQPEELAAAEAGLASAKAALWKAATGATAEQIAAAQAELANAEASVRQAQAFYDKVASAPDIGRRPESLQLEYATNEYYAAKARYEELTRGANPADVASAKAQVDRAQAELDALKAPPRAADLAAAQAEVRHAQAQLDLLLAGPQAEQVRIAEADVVVAEAALAQAQALLSEVELRAPFPGVVAALDVGVGQQAIPGVTVLRFGDFSGWLIETSDLTELEVIDIREGDPATISIDALPTLTLSGKVVRIRAIGESRQGDITYTVLVKPDQSDDRLRWNMTAKVTVEPGGG